MRPKKVGDQQDQEDEDRRPDQRDDHALARGQVFHLAGDLANLAVRQARDARHGLGRVDAERDHLRTHLLPLQERADLVPLEPGIALRLIADHLVAKHLVGGHQRRLRDAERQDVISRTIAMVSATARPNSRTGHVKRPDLGQACTSGPLQADSPPSLPKR